MFKGNPMRETIRKWIQRICELLELLVAVLVLIGIVMPW